jgi:hypothetical protein
VLTQTLVADYESIIIQGVFCGVVVQEFKLIQWDSTTGIHLGRNAVL